MRLSRARALVVPVILFTLVRPAAAQERDRTKIPDRYKWNLADLYPSDDAWRRAKEAFAANVSQVGQFKASAATSATRLADVLDLSSRLNKELSRIYVYAGLSADQDTRLAKYQGMNQEMQQLAAKFNAELAYLEPEILKVDKTALDRWIASEPRLRPYAHYLDDLQRRRVHTLSDAEERLLANAAVVANAPSNTYTLLSNADFPYPTVTLGDGRSVKLDASAFNLYRALPNRDDRQKVMSAFFNALGAFKGTLGSTLNGQVQANEFYAQARRYPTALESALDANAIPTSVYTELVRGVDEALPTLHRYLQLRKKMMGLQELHYYDLYAPLVASVDLTYTPEEAESLVMSALAPLGAEYTAAAKRAFAERWIDLLPNEGKRTGAYSNGSAYDVHPYMLINFNGKYADVSTIAHELGHTMQSYWSNKTQPYPTAGYPIFVAEVASTFNESLLIEQMLKRIGDPKVRLSLLGNELENIKGTMFRQVQFAEFELRMHEMAEKGQPITGESLDALYLEITRKYYGHDKGVCIVDDYVAHEWAFIPHFYLDFYVYQYATSFTASSALSEKVLAGDPGAVKRYLAFISAGGSDYPIALLKNAGVDMTTSEPLRLTMQKMNRVIDEMEKLIR